MCTLIFELKPGIGSGTCDPNEKAQFGYLLFSTNPNVRSPYLLEHTF
jgi:hypothetical protein